MKPRKIDQITFLFDFITICPELLDLESWSFARRLLLILQIFSSFTKEKIVMS